MFEVFPVVAFWTTSNSVKIDTAHRFFKLFFWKSAGGNRKSASFLKLVLAPSIEWNDQFQNAGAG